MSERDPVIFAKALPGNTAPPPSYWDRRFSLVAATEARIRFYPEVEVKHGRVAMLAALGFVVAEQFHRSGAVPSTRPLTWPSEHHSGPAGGRRYRVAAVFVSVASFMF